MNLELLSATDEDLQVAEDWLREQGRHDEANRIMGFRRFEPMLRRFAAAEDAANRIYVENGQSFKSRYKKRRAAIDAVTSERYRLENELKALIWEVFGAYVEPWKRGRAREIGKSFDGDGESAPLEVSDAYAF